MLAGRDEPLAYGLIFLVRPSVTALQRCRSRAGARVRCAGPRASSRFEDPFAEPSSRRFDVNGSIASPPRLSFPQNRSRRRTRYFTKNLEEERAYGKSNSAPDNSTERKTSPGLVSRSCPLLAPSLPLLSSLRSVQSRTSGGFISFSIDGAFPASRDSISAFRVCEMCWKGNYRQRFRSYSHNVEQRYSARARARIVVMRMMPSSPLARRGLVNLAA
jgi:hypothetical protein